MLAKQNNIANDVTYSVTPANKEVAGNITAATTPRGIIEAPAYKPST